MSSDCYARDTPVKSRTGKLTGKLTGGSRHCALEGCQEGGALKTHHLELRGVAVVKGRLSVRATDDKDAVAKMRENVGIDEDSVEVIDAEVRP